MIRLVHSAISLKFPTECLISLMNVSASRKRIYQGIIPGIQSKHASSMDQHRLGLPDVLGRT